jgi:hypothetical protein
LYHGVRVWASEKRTACCKRHVQKLHDVHKMPIAEIARRAWVPPNSVWNLYLGIPKRAKLENIKALWTVRADRS